MAHALLLLHLMQRSSFYIVRMRSYKLLWEICFVMAEKNNISYVWRHGCAIELCVKLGKSCEESLMMSQSAYGKEAMNRAAMFRWWTHFKDGNKKVLCNCINFFYNDYILRYLMRFNFTFMVFENKMLRKMLMHKRQVLIAYWAKLYNEALHNLCYS
jgi:hypothetical protein